MKESEKPEHMTLLFKAVKSASKKWRRKKRGSWNRAKAKSDGIDDLVARFKKPRSLVNAVIATLEVD